jgi:hypothetical protein
VNERRRALERILEQRPSKPLKHGDHMLLAYALRCRCKVCERILTWGDCDSQGLISAVCCKQQYTLKTWSVKVWIEDVSDKPLLGTMPGSSYPNADLRLRFDGEDSPGGT